MPRGGRAFSEAKARMAAHRQRICTCEPLSVDVTRRNPLCSIHGDRADVNSDSGFVCPACVSFGRSQCRMHKDTSIAALERMTRDADDAA